MSNAFVPDEKRRHQYFPVNEDPPNYEVASGRTSDVGPSEPSRASRQSTRRERPARTRRQRRARSSADDEGDDTAEGDALDALPSGNGDEDDDDLESAGHHAGPHRANSEDSDVSSIHEFHELELDTETEKEPVLIRLTKRIHRITVRVDKVLYTYVNATIMRYVYGAILGVFVVLLVYLFGGSMPRLVIPKRYREDALRTYINEESKSSNIKLFTEQLAAVYNKHQTVDALFDRTKLVQWVHDEFVKLGVARNAIDDYFVYYPKPISGGQSLEMTGPAGEVYAADVVDDHGHPRSFITHGATGNVSAPLVYVNHATPNDLAWLQDAKVDVAGSIVMFQQDSEIQLAQQILNVQLSGALGCIVFAPSGNTTDPNGGTYPDGPYIPSSSVLGGDAALTWIQPGDVLTPGWVSTKVTKVVDSAECPALVTIPAMSISQDDALQFLSFNENFGTKIKSDWLIAGQTDGQYYTGSNAPGSPLVQLVNLVQKEIKHPIHNVLSEIDGDESDQVLIVGASLSDLSTVATLLEVSRVFADLVSKYSWRPRRSVIFALWEGTDQNYLGSTEWVEEQRKSLEHQGIAYINLVNAASIEDEILVRATPSLSGALLQAMQHVQNVHGNATVAEDLGLSMLSTTAEPVGFSDSIAFEAHAGVPVADIGYADGRLLHGDCLHSAACIESYLDPGFAKHLVLAKTFAMVILELVDERFIPLDVHAYARSIESAITSLSKVYPDLNFGGDLNRVMQTLDQATDLTMQWKDEWTKAFLENKQIESPVWALKRSNWNYAVTTFHRNLLRSAGWTTWFAHPIYGPSRGTDGTGGRKWMFPHLEDAYWTGDKGRTQGMIELLGQTIRDAAEALRP
ncbi:putative Glutamate carboxypeptidase Tre2 [Taphrina deformans PYCC 5710]|uniref:Glutamate carboxypeptidase Tre2 n=1 Tax=Taphrina deformans (strain PYCC 5710 / ATCC 11124 / CBS 356.35 / IMI 108563 / JCM 9778 / NBRC 8474) TaxID=1097556 RepID=R4XFY8_TAPDE|nr:putative Glutamate carboxypeptidase Tre2 [Taphrina deformans PYCC 5710]|eukprot:CCG82294.1 putative Glutamate carboxypeptidase Tre2 [Taphrina deformans PYCC 5710]